MRKEEFADLQYRMLISKHKESIKKEIYENIMLMLNTDAFYNSYGSLHVGDVVTVVHVLNLLNEEFVNDRILSNIEEYAKSDVYDNYFYVDHDILEDLVDEYLFEIVDGLLNIIETNNLGCGHIELESGNLYANPIADLKEEEDFINLKLKTIKSQYIELCCELYRKTYDVYLS